MSDHRHGIVVIGPDDREPAIDEICPRESRGEDGLTCGWMRVTAEEWMLRQAEESGETIRFRVRRGYGVDSEMTGWIKGTVTSTMLYDGISAKVVEDDPDDRIVWTVIPSCGAQVERITS